MVATKGAQWVLGARSETGYVRTANEDRMGFIRAPFGNVYVVSDGMGGYRGGALAADLTVNTLRQALSSATADQASVPDRVREAFAAANQAVFERRRHDDPDTRNMGATAVVLVTAGTRVLVGHVGDSRAYLVRSRSLRRLTTDHTRVQRMVEAGVLTMAQAAEHPSANVLDRAIGNQPTVEVDLSGWIELIPRDMFLLCSDGLTGYAQDSEIEKVLRMRGSPQELADNLVNLALSKGGEDNVTVQLVRFGRGAGSPWWRRFAQPGFVAPATMLASAAVAWTVASPHLDEARARIANLEAQLEEARLGRGDLQKRVETLSTANTQLQSTIDSLRADAQRVAEASAAQVAPPSPPPAAVRSTVRPAQVAAVEPRIRRPGARTVAAPPTVSGGPAPTPETQSAITQTSAPQVPAAASAVPPVPPASNSGASP
jgi:serine/threonine protein phosphatase PrpC